MFGCFPPCKPVVAVLRDSLGIRYIIVLSCVADCCEVERYVLKYNKEDYYYYY